MKKNLLILVTICCGFSNLLAQNRIEIPMSPNLDGKGSVNLSLNGKESMFALENDLSGVFICSSFLNELNLKQTDYIRNAVLVNDSLKTNVEVYRIKSLKIDTIEIKNVEVFFDKKTNAQLIGTKFLQKYFYNVTVDSTKDILTFESKIILQTINNIKFVPCSVNDIIIVPNLQTKINSLLNVNTFSQENNVPPPLNAVSRVNKGITIRYFETETKEIAFLIKNNLQKDTNYSGTEISVENMLPFIPNQIKSYIEIWIK